MTMNFYILPFISLPEAILNAIIILLFAGAKNKLKINKLNVIRFIICLILLLTSTYLIRPLARSVIENIFLNSIAYIIILTIIYRLKFSHAALSVLFTILLFATIENLYFPFIVAYISESIEAFQQNYHLFPLYSIPSRILQVAIITYLWKYEILLVTKINRRFHKTFIFSTSILVFVEYFFGYIFYSYFYTFSFAEQLIYALSLIIMVIVINILIFNTIYVTIGKIILNGFNQYNELEEDFKMALGVIYNLIKNKEIKEASNLIEELQGIQSQTHGEGGEVNEKEL